MGGSWVIATGTTNTAQIDATGRCAGTVSSAEADYINQGTPASADYSVQADLWSGSSSQTNYAGVFGRTDASAGNNGSTGRAYLGQYDHGSLAWSIQKAVNGTFTQVGSSFGATLTASTTTTFKLTMTGTALVLNVAGTDRVTTTDSAVTAAAKAGLFISAGLSPGGGSIELDNFLAADGAVAGTFPPIPAVWHNPLIPM